MINAIRYNKVKRGIFKSNEDSLTSFVFEKLLYLPLELFKYILVNSVKDDMENIDFTSLNEIIFWPHWKSEGTDNKKHVEPDIFLRFDTYDLIIEAKRYDDYQQDVYQWKKEIRGYLNEYEEENKKIVFIALGGINKYKTEKITVKDSVFNVYKCRWASILSNIKLVKSKIELSSEVLNSSIPTINVLNDLIIGFGIYGFSTADWFENFNYQKRINNESIIHLLKDKFKNEKTRI